MLYIVDEPMADIAFRTVAGDDDPVVVLIQDGVLIDPAEHGVDPAADDGPTVYAVERDVDVRGVDLPAGVETVTHGDLVDTIFEREVRNFV